MSYSSFNNKLPASDTYEERKKRNTICFTPDYSQSDLRVQVGNGMWSRFAFPIMENDVILVPALFHDLFKDSRKAYDELMNEMNYDDFCHGMATNNWTEHIGL